MLLTRFLVDDRPDCRCLHLEHGAGADLPGRPLRHVLPHGAGAEVRQRDEEASAGEGGGCSEEEAGLRPASGQDYHQRTPAQFVQVSKKLPRTVVHFLYLYTFYRSKWILDETVLSILEHQPSSDWSASLAKSFSSSPSGRGGQQRSVQDLVGLVERNHNSMDEIRGGLSVYANMVEAIVQMRKHQKDDLRE